MGQAEVKNIDNITCLCLTFWALKVNIAMTINMHFSSMLGSQRANKEAVSFSSV